MKRILIIGLVAALAGCATHASIEMPAVTQVNSAAFENKSLSYEILYSQPKPGMFSGGAQMPFSPIEDATFSVASAATLKKLPDYIFQQLPSNVRRAESGEGDLKLTVELTAYDKQGPTYSDYRAGVSFAKNLATLGFAPSDYNIVAEFDVNYSLQNGADTVFSKSYKVSDVVPHQRGDLDSFNSLNDYAGQLLEKHLMLTLNDFFKQASDKL